MHGSALDGPLNDPVSRELETLHAAVFRYAYRMLGDWEEAQDVTQEAFTRWAANRQELRGPDSTRRWLFVVARNLAYTQLRARSRAASQSAELAASEVVAESPRDCESQQETAAMVARAVQSLPPELREAIVLREYESMAYDEIARITETALGTVKSRIARGRALLRKKLHVLLEVES